MPGKCSTKKQAMQVSAQKSLRKAEKKASQTPRTVAAKIVKNNQNNPMLGEYIVPKAKYGTFKQEGFSERQNRKMNKTIVKKTKSINTSNSPQGWKYES